MRKYILCLIASLSLVSCSDWLEAVSSTQFQEKDVFSSREGFQDALTGIYICMGAEQAYGTNMTFRCADYLVYPYTQQTGNHYQIHNYTNSTVAVTITETWLQLYKTIAGVNMVLSHLEESRELFTCDLEYNMYYGELLGLRAFLHFDLLRLFGLDSWGAENANKLTIPFQLSLTYKQAPQVTYAKAYELLLEDINASISYLEQDPVRGVKDEVFENNANFEGYWNYRNLHFNYYAALALKARIQMWAKDYESAALCAEQVVNEVFDNDFINWVDTDELLASGQIGSKDFSFSTEHIFALDIQELNQNVLSFLGVNSIGANNVNTIPENFVNTVLYPSVDEFGALSGMEDVRGMAFQLRYFANAYVSYKLYSEGTTYSKYRNKMPLIRISEMYYILAECAINDNDNAKAIEYLNIVRKARAIQSDLPQSADAMKILNVEYYREFINEGQIIYWVKRHGLDDYLGFEYMNLTKDMLVIPYPSNESTYGLIQER